MDSLLSHPLALPMTLQSREMAQAARSAGLLKDLYTDRS